MGSVSVSENGCGSIRFSLWLVSNRKYDTIRKGVYIQKGREMRKTLCAATLAILTTAAFGAASLRAPQLGGGATATPATTATTARAGTLRAQTKKTSMSTSTATPTVTASISEPVATETTDARLSFLKSVKGFNPGKIKDTTSAQQELNNINAQIEELQSKLDAAESAQATVLTEDTIDGKITANVTSKTYTKAEIDNLLSTLEKKLPKVDDKGNMTWTDPNGNLVAHSLYWINLEGTIDLYRNIWDGQRFHYGTMYVYRTNKTDEAIQQYISSGICNNETSDWCWVSSIDNTQDGKYVFVVHMDHTYQYTGVLYNAVQAYPDSTNPFYVPGSVDRTQQSYVTYESPEYVRNSVCGAQPQTNCYIGDNLQQWNETVYGKPKTLSSVEIVIPGLHTGNNFENSVISNSNTGLTTRYLIGAASNVTQSQINEYVNNFCNNSSNWWCYISNNQITNLSTGTKLFVIVKRSPGYVLLDSHIMNNNGEILLNKIFSTNEENPDTYIHDTICKNKPVSECYVAEYWDMITINNNIQSGLGEHGDRYQVSVIETSIAPNPDPGTATPSYIPLK